MAKSTCERFGSSMKRILSWTSSSKSSTTVFWERNIYMLLRHYSCIAKSPDLGNFSDIERLMPLYILHEFVVEKMHWKTIGTPRGSYEMMPSASNTWSILLPQWKFWWSCHYRGLLPTYWMWHELTSLFARFYSMWLFSFICTWKTWCTVIFLKDWRTNTEHFCRMWDHSSCNFNKNLC